MVPSVLNTLLRILRPGAPSKIFNMVVGWVVIFVEALHPFRTRPNKSLEDYPVDKHFVWLLVLPQTNELVPC